jgi:hypothetical protein
LETWLTLNIGSLESLEKSVTLYPSTWHNIPKDLDLHVCEMCNIGFRGFALSCFAAVPTAVHTSHSPSSGWMWQKEHTVQCTDMPFVMAGQYRMW